MSEEPKTLEDVGKAIQESPKKRRGRRSADPTELRDPEDVAEAATAIKDAAQRRRARRAAEVEELNKKYRRPSRIDMLKAAKAGEMLELKELPDGVTPADYLMARARDREQKLYADAAKLDSATYQYAVRCHRCDRHGIYFTENPAGRTVPPTGWFAMYKKQDEPWLNTDVPCQACLSDGHEVPLRVEISTTSYRGGVHLRIAGKTLRYVVKFPKDEERYIEEGETPILERGRDF